MEDIFKEVDEELRQEKISMLWKKYGGILVTVCLAFVLSVAGYKAWDYYNHTIEVDRSFNVLKAIHLAESNEGTEKKLGIKELENIAKNENSGFAALADFKLAEIKLNNHEGKDIGSLKKEVAGLYLNVAKKKNIHEAIKDIANLRASLLLLDTSDFTTVNEIIGYLDDPAKYLRNTAREVLAYSAIKEKDYSKAKDFFDDIVVENDIDPSLQRRARAMVSWLKPKILPESDSDGGDANIPQNDSKNNGNEVNK